jgi:hypothetical protein
MCFLVVAFCQTLCIFCPLKLRWGLYWWFLVCLQQVNNSNVTMECTQQDARSITQEIAINTSDLIY